MVRDKERKLEDAEASHTLAGAGEGGTQGEGSGDETRFLGVGGVSVCVCRDWGAIV